VAGWTIERRGKDGGHRSGDLARTMPNATDGAGGTQTTKFDLIASYAVVFANKKELDPCSKQEADRTPGLTATIPVEFVIGNDGRVADPSIFDQNHNSGRGRSTSACSPS
jgi:hypothetical protein